ncbi:hypothetical protein GC194_08265 [bacterium]|nr:hypothetical protein [bacterium]
MKGINFKKYILPHLIAVGIFLLIGIIYFNPVLDGEVLPTHDITMHSGAAKEIRDFHEKSGEYSLWTNSMFGGMPAYQIAAHFPNSLFLTKPLYSMLTHGLPKPMNMLFLYFIGFYLMMLSFKVDWRLALAGAIAYGFASYNIIIIDAGHNTKALAIGFAPLVIGAVNMALNSKRWILGAALAGLALGFQLKVNHVQITYYTMFILLAMGTAWLVDKIQKKEFNELLRRAAVLLFAVILGIGANAGNILTTAEYSALTTRGKGNLVNKKGEKEKGLDLTYITNWSYGKAETGTLIIPNFSGGGSQSHMDYTDMELYKMAKQQMGPNGAERYIASVMYWGPQPGTNGPVYIGALICFLFVFGFMVTKNQTRIWILAVSIIAIILSWGSNFMWFTKLFYNYFPGYNKFRTVTMILAIVQITFPLLALLGLQKLFSGELKKQEVIKALKWSLGIAGGFVLCFAIMPGLFLDFSKDSDAQLQPQILDMIMEGREKLLKADAFRSLIFILLGGGTIWLYSTDKLKKQYAAIAFIALFAIDLWPVAARYLGPDRFEKESKEEVVMTKIDRQILQDPDPDYRVLKVQNNPRSIDASFNDATVSYFHKSIGGYHGAKLKRAQEVISNILRFEMLGLVKTKYQNPDISPMLNAFNTKYFIKVNNNGSQELIKNKGALGHAWFVDKVSVYDDANAEMAALETFKPKNEATTVAEFADYVADAKFGTGTIELVEYEPNHLKYECNASGEGFVVFSEVYYRGNTDWVSTIDGKETDHIRVDYLLRGMKVPAGKSTIEFRFDPPTYHKAETYSLISSILLLLMVLGGAYMAWKEGPSTDAENA